MIYNHIRLFLLSTLLLFLFVQTSHAQRTFGVNWDPPVFSQAALDELRQFDEMGISAIEVNEQLDAAVWKEIHNLQFDIYGHLGIEFPITTTFAEPDSSLIRSIENNASTYLAQSSLQAIGLFEYGPIHQPNFRKAVSPYLNQIQTAGATTYFTSSEVLSRSNISTDFIIYDVRVTPNNVSNLNLPQSSLIGAYKFSPHKELEEYLSPLKQLIDATSTSPEKPIFLHSEWLLKMVEKYPDFKSTLQSLSENTGAAFPIPNEKLPEQNPSVIPILTLLIAWGTIAWLYHSSPIYRKSLFRYFLGHKFFLKDVFGRQMRSPIPALTILVLNSLLFAASIYATFATVFTSLGQEGLFYYFPTLEIAGPTPISLFIGAFFLLIILSVISILWLFFSHKDIKSITQIAIIYAWPLQVSFITATVAITLFSAGDHDLWIAVFTLLSFFIQLISFILASIDATGFLRKKSYLYLVLTSGVYLSLIGAMATWMYIEKSWLEILDLLISLK